MRETEFAVLGAGLAGSATAWKLAEAGHDVTILERSTPANEWGSSHGSARILRYAYPSDFYTGLALKARRHWNDLDESSHEQIFTPTGALDYGVSRRPGHLADVLEQFGVEHELLTAKVAMERWPMFTFTTDVLWHPDAGVFDPERAVQAMIKRAVSHEATLVNDWEAVSIERAKNGFRVTSSAEQVVQAGSIIVCIGGWLPQLRDRLPVPADFLPELNHIRILQEQAYHFPYREEVGGPGEWPTFIYKSDAIEAYGLPGGGDAAFAGQKIAEYHGGKYISSAAAQDGRMDAGNRDRIREFVLRHLPGLEPTSYAETSCLFSSTPTRDFIMDTFEGLTLVSACSGHGGKFAPLIGHMAAGLASGAGEIPELFRTARSWPSRLAGIEE